MKKMAQKQIAKVFLISFIYKHKTHNSRREKRKMNDLLMENRMIERPKLHTSNSNNNNKKNIGEDEVQETKSRGKTSKFFVQCTSLLFLDLLKTEI